MAPKSHAIPAEKWESHKETIKGLFARKPLAEVIEEMKQKHGFYATKSQYESKLRLWGFGKNLKREQWQAILNQPDSVTATGLTTFPGHVKKQPSIQRALKRLKKKSGVALAQTSCVLAPSHPLSGMASSSINPCMQQVSQPTLAQELSIEQTHGETRSPGLDGVSGPNSALLRLGEATTQFNPADFAGPYVSEFNDYMLFGSPFDFNSLLDSQLNGNSFVGGGRDMLMFDSNLSSGSNWQIPATANASPLETSLTRRASPISPFQFPLDNDNFFGHQSEQAQLENHVSPTDHLNRLSTSAQLPAQNGVLEGEILDCAMFFPCYTELLKGLPFAKFEEYLSSQNVIFTNSEPSTQRPLGASLSGSLALKCLENSFCSGSQGMVQFPSQSQNYIQKLAKLLPGESTTVISQQQMTETRLIRILLFSMINGFGGLQSVSVEDILKSMGHFGVNKLLLQILQEAPPFVSRTLADNMFRAAIEAKDQRTVQLLLKRKLVDVNDTVCFFQNHRFTPVERAASLQALRLVEILVEADADVNKTHENNGYPDGALGNLLRAAVEPKCFNSPSSAVTATPDLIATLDFLIRKGAKVDTHLLAAHLRSFTTNEVICLISRNLQSTDHRTFFEPSVYPWDASLLCQTARFLDDSTATTVIQTIIELCEKSGCSKCLETKPEVLEYALINGAKRGHLKLVQLLISHVPSTTRILSAAIKSGSEDLIRLVLHFDPNLELDPPAHRFSGSKNTYDIPFADTLLTSPLAEAIRTGNADLVKQLEDAGALKNLAEGNRLEALVLAAAEAGNMLYMKSLLRRAASSANKYRPDWLAVRLALENDHDEVAKSLLLAGAQFRRHSPGALGAALRKRDPELVRSLLSADIGSTLETGEIPNDVASWFDTSILSDLTFVFPDLTFVFPNLPSQTEDQELSFFGINKTTTLQGICIQCMKTDNVIFFKTFLESISPTNFPWNSCLASAIRMGHGKMVELLLDYGASPFDDEVLKAATPDRTNMLPLLFGEGQKQRRVRQCIGAHILKFVIAERPSNAEVLDTLLENGMVNLVAAERPNGFHGNMLTPLGLAIVGLYGFCETNLGAVKRLLRAGSDSNGIARIELTMGVRVGQTALMLALETGREGLVRLLVEEYQADVSKQTHLFIKQTPLQYAAKLGNLEMVRLLLDLGADVNEEPAMRSGGTALQYAAISVDCNMAAELLEKGAQLHALPSKVNGRWPLEGAAECGRLDMIQFLWRANEVSDGPGFQDRHCLRAMDFARSNGHLGCRDLIANLSDIALDRLESDDYGVPWLSY